MARSSQVCLQRWSSKVTFAVPPVWTTVAQGSKNSVQFANLHHQCRRTLDDIAPPKMVDLRASPPSKPSRSLHLLPMQAPSQARPSPILHAVSGIALLESIRCPGTDRYHDAVSVRFGH